MIHTLSTPSRRGRWTTSTPSTGTVDSDLLLTRGFVELSTIHSAYYSYYRLH